jgi:hypothetical protein
MTGYRTWEDLDDESPHGEQRRIVKRPIPRGSTTAADAIDGTVDAIAGLGAPPELVQLLRQKEALEAQLRQFAEGE